MSTRRRTVVALTALITAAGLVPASAATAPDPERQPERVTGVPRPAAPVPPGSPGDLGSAGTPGDLGSSSTATAVPNPTIAARLQSRSQAIVPTFGGKVSDVGSGAKIWSRGSTVGMRPASATKVLTATSALRVLGASHRYRTTVLQSQSARDHVYLKGSGDPTLSTARLQQLAATTATSLKAEGITTATVRVDDSLFPRPTNATGWESSDVPQWVAPVRALVVDQQNSADTSMQAAKVYADALRA